MKDLGELTEPGLVFPDVGGTDASSALRDLAERLHERGVVDDPEHLYQKLWEREQLGSTGIGGGVAIPHCKLSGLDDVVVAVGISRSGIDFGAVDDLPVRLFFLVVSPMKAPAAHLQSLASISKWVKADAHVERILSLDDPHEIHELIRDESGPR